MTQPGLLRVEGTRMAAGGTPVTLKGFGLGGWMNMENLITGYAGAESQQRRALHRVLGDERYERFSRAFEGVEPHEAEALAEASAFRNRRIRERLATILRRAAR